MSNFEPLEAQLLAMQLLDSAAPTGGFAHSMGFETYIERGVISSPEGFSDWLESYIRHQLTYGDALAIRLVYAALNAEAHRDADGAVDSVVHIGQRLEASTLPLEIRAANKAMGERMVTIATHCLENTPESELFRTLTSFQRHCADGAVAQHPALVWGIVAAGLRLEPDKAVACYLFSVTMSLTLNAIRAIPLGQDAGQRVLRQAQRWVIDATAHSRKLKLYDLGATVPGLEIAQMQHARQRSRLFMS